MQLWQFEEVVGTKSNDLRYTSIYHGIKWTSRHDQHQDVSPWYKLKKQKRNKNKKSDKKTVRAIIKSNKELSPINTVPNELESIDSEESGSEESDTSSTLKASSETPNAQLTMEHVLVSIESGYNADGTMFDPTADEEY